MNVINTISIVNGVGVLTKEMLDNIKFIKDKNDPILLQINNQRPASYKDIKQ